MREFVICTESWTSSETKLDIGVQIGCIKSHKLIETYFSIVETLTIDLNKFANIDKCVWANMNRSHTLIETKKESVQWSGVNTEKNHFD